MRTTVAQDPAALPALLGGEKELPDAAEHERLFHWPIITAQDEQAVLRSGDMSGTNINKQFEAASAKWNGTAYALATCNGTAALLASMWACGVGAGDEIICPCSSTMMMP